MAAAEGRRGVVTAGTWCVDLNMLLERWPDEETTNDVLGYELRNGGSGSNLAFDMRRLNPALPVETIGVVGEDDHGRFLRAECDAHGVSHAQLQADGTGPTHFTNCYTVQGSGKRTHIFYQGVGARLDPTHFDFARTEARILHLGLPGVHDTMDRPWRGFANGWAAVLHAARAAGLRTNLELASIDRAKLAALARPCLTALDLLVVNDYEIGALADEPTIGTDGTDVAGVLRAARAVIGRGAMALVVVHFPRGAIAVDRAGIVTARGSTAIPPELVVGANGAGDAFAAGFLYGQHEGWDVDRSLQLAHASAGASMRALSTVGGVVEWRECLNLAAEWGWREPPC
jgi:sugar/nucleoside kinase (ribokinase family)